MPVPYPGWNVVYGEIPAASKWSQLGANDDALAAGTGISDLAILARHIAGGAVDLTKLNFAAMDTLTTPTAFNIGGGATTDIVSKSITIPAGCTKVLVLMAVRLQAQNASLQDMQAWVDYNAGTAVTMNGIVTSTASFQGSMASVTDVLSVTPGARVFKVRAVTSGGGLFNVGIGGRALIIPLAS